MKSLYQFIKICESNLNGTGSWEHRGDYKYARMVIKVLTSGEALKLGNKEVTGTYTATPDEIEALKAFDPTEHTYKDFDDIFGGKLHWNQIFKGQFSGYENGLASGNKGNAFEDEFVENFHTKYQGELEKALKLKEGTLDDYDAVSRGAENQRRPLVSQGGHIILSSNHETVGESVVDVEVSAPIAFRNGNDEVLNLSLKYGPKVTFCNAGITNLFPKQAFDKYKARGGNFEPQKAGDISGQTLLDMFGLDRNKFADTFVNYGAKKVEDNIVDVTNQVDKNMIFTFLRSVVGYNYVLVHQLGKKVHYVDLREEKDMNKLLGNRIKKATACYGGKKGTSKYVTMTIELDHMDIEFDFRDKQGNTYPRSLMANYTIHH